MGLDQRASTVGHQAHRDPRQGRLLHWSMDAACVLEKTRGNENHAYFRQNWGKEKLRGEERLHYLNTYLHCFPLIFSKKILACYAHSITFYFHPPIRERGTYTARTVKSITLKTGTKKRRFSFPLLMTWCHEIDHTKPKLNDELYTFSCTGRQSCREQDN